MGWLDWLNRLTITIINTNHVTSIFMWHITLAQMAVPTNHVMWHPLFHDLTALIVNWLDCRSYCINVGTSWCDNLVIHKLSMLSLHCYIHYVTWVCNTAGDICSCMFASTIAPLRNVRMAPVPKFISFGMGWGFKILLNKIRAIKMLRRDWPHV